MKVLITGGTGMVGKELGKALHAQGHEITILTRSTKSARTKLPFPAKIIEYTSQTLVPSEALIDIDIVYNLAGENIGEKRWSSKRKKELYSSRINTTKSLVDGINRNSKEGKNSIKKLISVSAIGIYGNRKDELLTEDSKVADDFLASICKEWENETKKLNDSSIQVINPRLGIVLSNSGGALDRLLPLFDLGIGGAVGNGQQWMSWIHIQDLVSLLIHLLNSKLTGPVNAVAPNPVTNNDFSKALARKFNKWLFPKTPAIILKTVLGEMSDLVLFSQKVDSKKIQNDGFQFKYPDIVSAFEDIVGNKQGDEEFIVEQWIPKTPEDVFGFFCDEKNLERITPPFLNFTVTNKSTEEIEKNTLIDYRLSLYGLPFKWKTQITEWSPPHMFVDLQLKGPYKKWHHTHELIPLAGGTLLRDKVRYKVPLGCLGKLVAGHKVKSDVQKIFKYRREYIAIEFFP